MHHRPAGPGRRARKGGGGSSPEKDIERTFDPRGRHALVDGVESIFDLDQFATTRDRPRQTSPVILNRHLRGGTTRFVRTYPGEKVVREKE